MIRRTSARAACARLGGTGMALAALLLAGCQSGGDVRDDSAFAHPGWKKQRELQARAASGERVPETASGEWVAYQLERRLPEGMDQLPMDVMARASQQRKSMQPYSIKRNEVLRAKLTGSAKAAADWEWLGPANIAGRGRTLAFHPDDPAKLYTSGVSGGVWRSDNAGGNWIPLSDGAENINVGALLVDPVDPNTIYAGTGELYRNSARPYSAMWGQGILRSRDGGQTFQQLLSTANDDFRYVADVVLSPNDHNRVYAATNSGVWMSRDAGATFERILRPVDDIDRVLYEGCNDLLIMPDGGNDRLFAACSSRSTDDRYWLPGSVTPPACGTTPCPAAIFYNADAGGTGAWNSVLTEFGMGRTTLALAPSNHQILYAVSASVQRGFDRNGDGAGDYENGLHALFCSNDGGLTWQARLRNDSPDALSTYLFSYADGMEAPRCGFGSFFNYSAGWYNQAIAVDPLNPETVWVAGMDIYRSDDGGASFGMASYWYLNGVQQEGIHADQHLLIFDPDFNGTTNQRLYAVNDGGVWKTEQARGNVSRGINAACGPSNGVLGWQPLNAGLGTVQYYSGATTPDGQRYIAGAQDNGTHLGEIARGTAGWRHIFGGDGADVAIDPTNANRFFVSYQNVNIHRTTNGGNSFVRATNGLNDTPIFIMPYVMDPNDPNRLWAGATRVWTSSNGGDQWTGVSGRFGADYDSRVSAIAVSPLNPDRVLAANRRGIHRNDAARSGTPTTFWNAAAPRQGWVSSITYSPHDLNVVYATYSTFGGDHVWKSSDGGTQWQPIDGTGDGRLPDIAVHTLAIDPTDPQRLFIGTDLGIFVSLDDGAHWVAENNGFANVIVERLVTTKGVGGQPPMLYAFTYGRGAWRVKLDELEGQADYRIDERASGSFYDPAQSGQGWLLESLVVDGVRWIAASWYTYLDGEQVWLLGAAPVDRDRVSIPLFEYAGGAFPPDFDPSEVTNRAWGTLEFVFDTPDQGIATWQTSLPEYANGSAAFQRLTRPGTTTTTSQLSACHSGSWYQPAESGHGLQVEVVDDGAGGQSMFAIWYHYLDGAPAWLLGLGPVDGDHVDLDVSLTRGADFPPGFDPADVEHVPWGDLRFTVTGPDTARIEWQSEVAGYGAGSLDLQRLTRLAGQACDGVAAKRID